MKKRTKHITDIKTFFNRYHHYILTAICLLFIAGPLAITGCNTTDSDNGNEEEEGLETLRQATEQYKDVTVAIDDGFEQFLPCTENPEGPGAIGVVYANLDRLDMTIDLSKPEVLFYEPQPDGDLQLVGGEPVVPIEQWDESESDPPSMFDREFHRNEEHGLYGLHMWVWRENPEGGFAFWHSNVSCEYAQ